MGSNGSMHSHSLSGTIHGDCSPRLTADLIESGLDAGFDLVGDVAVNLDNAFVEAVAVAVGLGRFRVCRRR